MKTIIKVLKKIGARIYQFIRMRVFDRFNKHIIWRNGMRYDCSSEFQRDIFKVLIEMESDIHFGLFGDYYLKMTWSEKDGVKIEHVDPVNQAIVSGYIPMNEQSYSRIFRNPDEESLLKRIEHIDEPAFKCGDTTIGTDSMKKTWPVRLIRNSEFDPNEDEEDEIEPVKNEFPYGWDDLTPEEKINHALSRLGSMSAQERWAIRNSDAYIKAKEKYDHIQRICALVFGEEKSMYAIPPCGLMRKEKN